MDTPAPPKHPHSGLGIASCILGIISGAAFFTFAMLSLVVGLFDTTVSLFTSGAVKHNTQAQMMPFLVMTGTGIVVALGLGIAGWMQENRKKIFAISGCVISVIAALPMLEMLGII